jgi:hypothetical protein
VVVIRSAPASTVAVPKFWVYDGDDGPVNDTETETGGGAHASFRCLLRLFALLLEDDFSPWPPFSALIPQPPREQLPLRSSVTVPATGRAR